MHFRQSIQLVVAGPVLAASPVHAIIGPEDPADAPRTLGVPVTLVGNFTASTDSGVFPVTTDFTVTGDFFVNGDFSMPQGVYVAATKGKAPLSLELTLQVACGDEIEPHTVSVPLNAMKLLSSKLGPVVTLRATFSFTDVLEDGMSSAMIIGPDNWRFGIIGPERFQTATH